MNRKAAKKTAKKPKKEKVVKTKAEIKKVVLKRRKIQAFIAKKDGLISVFFILIEYIAKKHPPNGECF